MPAIKSKGYVKAKSAPGGRFGVIRKITQFFQRKRGLPKTQPVGKQSKPQTRRSTSSDWSGLSLDRKLDIIGTGLVVVGLITLLSMLAGAGNFLASSWLDFLKGLFGIGVFLLPLALVAVGIWLVLRHSNRLPVFGLERLIGIGLLYVNFLAWLHLLYCLLSLQESRITELSSISIEVVSQAGGLIGGLPAHVLLLAFGVWGTTIVLVAWLIISLAMSLDLPVPELFRWIPPLWQRINNWLKKIAEERRVKPEPSAHAIPPALATKPNPPSSQSVAQNTNLASASALELASSAETSQVWVLPVVEQILDLADETRHDEDANMKRASIIEETLTSFGAPAHIVEINSGPTITQFGLEPDFLETRKGRMKVRVGKIAALADDLALALAAKRIRIQAPVPGKGFVGIEVPNDRPMLVTLRGVIESPAFEKLRSPLRFALGQNVSGEAVAYDLSAMPHLLIAGTTGSGKSVCVNSIVSCLLIHNTPDTLRLIMVDPKRVELTGYNGIPHLLAPVVVDLKQVVGALQWVTREMDRRYHIFADAGVRNIAEYNRSLLRKPVAGQPVKTPEAKTFPYLVVIIDELADLMMLAPDETERSITRLAQLARATGIHLILATQRPSVDVLTGVIKANFPARIAFAVASGIDSRVILDQPGAERLLGSGDMLFQSPESPAAVRLQGVFVSDIEIQRIVQHWRSFLAASNPSSETGGEQPSSLPVGIPLKQLSFLTEDKQNDEADDPLLKEAIDLARRQGRASVSMLQRRMRIGYTRAARLIETMEARGIVGAPTQGTGTRDVLDYGEAAPPVDE